MLNIGVYSDGINDDRSKYKKMIVDENNLESWLSQELEIDYIGLYFHFSSLLSLKNQIFYRLKSTLIWNPILLYGITEQGYFMQNQLKMIILKFNQNY